jgi:hypothetical protein
LHTDIPYVGKSSWAAAHLLPARLPSASAIEQNPNEGTPRAVYAYQYQDSIQTMAQALEEYHAVHPGLSDAHQMSAEGQRFFSCHDAVHVVFGCGIDLDDEAVVKIASMLGTTAGLGVLKGYVLHETLEIYRQLRVLDVLRAIARSIVVLPRTIVRCAAQRKRWPWTDHHGYLNVSLRDIRQQFGIKVAHQATAPVH